MKESFKQFKKEIRKTLKHHYGDKIETAVLFGSFATGDAKEGSDLDLVIQLKPDIEREELDGIRDIIEEVDENYNIGGSWVFYDPILRLVHPMILEYDEIDWGQGKIKNMAMHWIISFGISEPLFFHHLRDKGEVLFGKQVLDDIDVSPNIFNDLVNLTGDPFYRLWKVITKTIYTHFYK